MNKLRRMIVLRLRSLFRRNAAEQDLDDELKFHIEQQTEAYIKVGMTPEEARRRVRLEFGGVEQIKEKCRDVRTLAFIESLLRDLRYGIRLLARSPGFTVVAVLTLALGIGANTAIFSIVNAILLRPLPIHEPDRLVEVYCQYPYTNVLSEFGYPLYREFRDRNTVLSNLAAYDYVPVSLRRGPTTERILAALVSGNYFATLGITAAHGRTFAAEENLIPGRNAVAVISHSLWQRHYGADPSTVGQPIELNGRQFMVIGIAPKGFTGTVIGSAPDVWMPLMMYEGIERIPAPLQKLGYDPLQSNGYSWLHLIGRLKPGVTLQQAQASLEALNAHVYNRPESSQRRKTWLVPITTARIPVQYQDTASLILGILFSVVGLVLVIACANVGNLSLARGSVRRKEIAVRLALGASRFRILRQLLVESLFLSLLAGGAGLLLAVWLIQALQLWWPLLKIPIWLDVSLDPRVLIFTGVVSVMAGIGFGLAPAVSVSRTSLLMALQSASRRVTRGHRLFGLNNILVAAQIALSLVLAITATLLLRTLLNIQSIDPGFNPRNVVVLKFDFEGNTWTRSARKALYTGLVDRFQSVPGIESASLVQYVPLTPRSAILDFDPRSRQNIQISSNVVMPGYFKTLGMPILRGRDFTPGDRKGETPVVIINESFARISFEGKDPIGELLDGRLVIGIVKDNKQEYIRGGTEPYEFLPFAQSEEPGMSLVIRVKGEAKRMVQAIRGSALEVDAKAPISSARLMTEHVDFFLWQPRTTAMLVAGFALLAIFLAVLGVYSVTSYAVTQRTQEIGIRMALGANRLDVLGMFLRQAALLGLIGIALGLAIALTTTRVLSSLLYGVSTTDQATYAGASLFLLLVALLACYLPARRATKVDPMVALRYE
jgi:predicted permease